MFYGDFRWNGNLKPGVEDQTPAGFFRKYVIPFPFSATRGVLFRGFVDYLRELDALGIMRGLFIGGSFVTLKENPHDVDVICCFSGEAFDRLSSGEADRAMPYLTDDAAMMRRFGVQPFPLPVYSPGDKYFPVTEFSVDWAAGLLATDREASPKGMVYMNWARIQTALSAGELEPMVRFCGRLHSRMDCRTPLYGKDETARRQHLVDIRRSMAEFSELAKEFPDVPSVNTLVHSLFCGLLRVLGGGDEAPEQDR